MSAGFTPGPWIVIRNDDDAGYGPSDIMPFGIEEQSSESAFQVASVIGDVDLPSEANARLIAAAPELYEALQLLLETEDFGNEREHWESEHKLGNGHAWRVLKAMDALAKARGEQ